MNSPKKLEIRISIDATNLDAPEVILREYLRSDDKPRSYREMIFSALRAFWLPVALMKRGADPAVVHQATVDSLYVLMMQCKYLEQKTGVALQIDSRFETKELKQQTDRASVAETEILSHSSNDDAMNGYPNLL